MDKVRLGIVGVGNMGSSHAQKLVEGAVTSCELTCICDIREDRIERARDAFGDGIHYFGSYDEMIASGQCDAVLIATPHYDHPTMGGIQALNAGLHTLIEKPAGGVYTKAVEELNAVANKTNKVFTIMYNQRTNLSTKKLEK